MTLDVPIACWPWVVTRQPRVRGIKDIRNKLPKVNGLFERAPRAERSFEPLPLPRADGSAGSRS